MPRIGPLELILILAVVLLIFGAGRLPEIGSALGKSIRAFKKSSSAEEDAIEGKKKEQSPEKPPTSPPK